MASEILPSQLKNDDASKKRALEENGADGSSSKKQKSEETGDARGPYRKKKMALLMMFSGKDYYGMQINRDVPTIERSLMDALLKAGVVTADHVSNPRDKMSFQRASRTDKGVSCVGQVVSLKINVDNALQKINDALPEQIRVLEVVQTTKGFDAKNKADARSYSYTMPTLAFTPHTEEPKEDFRVTEEILAKANEMFAMFKGSHSFYNYTSGRLATDRSCMRYITEFHTGEVFVKEGMEFVVVHVKGQSFMLHQIRKMIGLTIATVQGCVDKEYFKLSFGPERIDVPKAPGVGLMLDEVHFSCYNRKFGHDGIHKPITFTHHKERIQLFKHQHIFPNLAEAELKEKSMLNWVLEMREKHFRNNPLKPSDVSQDSSAENSADDSDDPQKWVKTESKHTPKPAENTQQNAQHSELSLEDLPKTKDIESTAAVKEEHTDSKVMKKEHTESTAMKVEHTEEVEIKQAEQAKS